jgi:hypothetical protein
MKMKKIFLFFIVVFTGSFLFAQTPVLKFQPLNFSPAKQFHFMNSAAANPNLVLSSPNPDHLPASFDPAIHFPAFFCRMELKAVEHFGIWIKVHAGDYDRYSRPFLR